MLERVLEPEVMDTVDDALSYDQMDHDAVNRLFVTDLCQVIHATGEILDLGTGTALIPIELCRRAPNIKVVAVDAAASMLERAQARVQEAGFQSRIQLVRADARTLPFASGCFDGVMSNSIIHHLAQPWPALVEAVRMVRAGGFLFFRDLIRPDSESEWQGLVEQYTIGETPYARQLFAQSLRAALSLDEVRQLVRALGFSADGVRKTSDRHWTWFARNPIA